MPSKYETTRSEVVKSLRFQAALINPVFQVIPPLDCHVKHPDVEDNIVWLRDPNPCSCPFCSELLSFQTATPCLCDLISPSVTSTQGIPPLSVPCHGNDCHGDASMWPSRPAGSSRSLLTGGRLLGDVAMEAL